MPGKPVPDTFKEAGFVGGHFGGGVDISADVALIGGGGVVIGGNLLTSDEEAVARSAKRSASDEGNEGFVGIDNESGDVARLDNFFFDDAISVAGGVVIDIDEVAVFEAFETGEDVFVGIAGINVARRVASDDKIADFARIGRGASETIMGDAVIHGRHDIRERNIEINRDVDVKLRNNQARLGGNGLSDSGVERLDLGRRSVARGNISHNRSKNQAIILQEKNDERDSDTSNERDETTATTGFFGAVASAAADFMAKFEAGGFFGG